MANAREVALLTLISCEKQGAWSDLALKKNLRDAQLDSRDAGLATKLCFGVLQNQMRCDFYIEGLSSVPLKKMDPAVRNALRLGVYQMVFLTKIPQSAAVNESVELTRTHSRNPRSPALVNGILRNMGRQLDKLPPVPQENLVDYLSIQYSHPKWLVEALTANLPKEEWESLLQCHNGEPPTTAQINTTRTTQEAVLAQLEADGVHGEPHPWLNNCITLTGTGDLERLPAFANGDLYIQDVGARLAVEAAGLQPGMQVLDTCAAPGGKSFAAAIAMKNEGNVTACDIHPHKMKLIADGAQRLGLKGITEQVVDGKIITDDFKNAFDVVITDAPCSGLGIIRKKPDIRYKDPAPLKRLPQIQHWILSNAAFYVKPGGALLYCTCTLLERENQGVITDFLSQNEDFELEAFTLPTPIGRVESGDITLWPHRHGTDGFYIAKLRKKGAQV